MSINISVIITTYNDSECLFSSIGSVLNQTNPPSEILIIDDGSSDDSAENVIQTFIKTTNIPMIFFKKLNGGPSSARNYGLARANYDYIAFLDADDLWTADNLEWKLTLLQSVGDDFAAVYGTCLTVNPSGKGICRRVLEMRGDIERRKLGRLNGIPGGSPFYVFRKTALLQVGGYDESLSFNEDFDLLLRMAEKWQFIGKNRPTLILNERTGSLTRSNPHRKFTGAEQFLDKAELYSLLPMDEIAMRRKENRLVFAAALKRAGNSWSIVAKVLAEAFIFDKPRSLREFIAFMISLMSRYCNRISNK